MEDTIWSPRRLGRRGWVEVKERHLVKVAGAIACRVHCACRCGNCRQGWLQGRWGLELVPVRMDVPEEMQPQLDVQADLPC